MDSREDFEKNHYEVNKTKPVVCGGDELVSSLVLNTKNNGDLHCSSHIPVLSTCPQCGFSNDSGLNWCSGCNYFLIGLDSPLPTPRDDFVAKTGEFSGKPMLEDKALLLPFDVFHTADLAQIRDVHTTNIYSANSDQNLQMANSSHNYPNIQPDGDRYLDNSSQGSYDSQASLLGADLNYSILESGELKTPAASGGGPIATRLHEPFVNGHDFVPNDTTAPQFDRQRFISGPDTKLLEEMKMLGVEDSQFLPHSFPIRSFSFNHFENNTQLQHGASYNDPLQQCESPTVGLHIKPNYSCFSQSSTTPDQSCHQTFNNGLNDSWNVNRQLQHSTALNVHQHSATQQVNPPELFAHLDVQPCDHIPFQNGSYLVGQNFGSQPPPLLQAPTHSDAEFSNIFPRIRSYSFGMHSSNGGQFQKLPLNRQCQSPTWNATNVGFKMQSSSFINEPTSTFPITYSGSPVDLAAPFFGVGEAYIQNCSFPVTGGMSAPGRTQYIDRGPQGRQAQRSRGGCRNSASGNTTVEHHIAGCASGGRVPIRNWRRQYDSAQQFRQPSNIQQNNQQIPSAPRGQGLNSDNRQAPPFGARTRQPNWCGSTGRRHHKPNQRTAQPPVNHLVQYEQQQQQSQQHAIRWQHKLKSGHCQSYEPTRHMSGTCVRNRTGAVTKTQEPAATNAEPKSATDETVVNGERDGVTDDNVQTYDWMRLPDELWLAVITRLNYASRGRLAATCRRLARLVPDHSLWRRIVLTRHKTLNDTGLRAIGRLRPNRLEFNYCRGDDVTENGVKWLFGQCGESLTHISLVGCTKGAFQQPRLVHLLAALCPGLRYVDLSYASVLEDRCVLHLAREARCLVSVLLNGAQNITNWAVKRLVHFHSDSLERLELFGCFRLNSDMFNVLGKCHALRALAVGHCHHLSSAGFLELVRKLPLLASLDLRGTHTLSTAISFTQLAQRCPHLEEMVLANLKTLATEQSVADMFGCLPRLRLVDLCGLTAVGDATMGVLASCCPDLEELDVTCTSVTKAGIESLAEAPAQSLRCLRLSHCREITQESLEKLIKSCTKLMHICVFGLDFVNRQSLLDIRASLKIEGDEIVNSTAPNETANAPEVSSSL